VVISNDSTGSLMKYNPSTQKLTILQSRLTYPNGLVVSHDGTHLLVCFTSMFQIHKYWIKKGPKTGSFEHFANLPGYPDNIKRNSRGEYWVVMVPKKHDDPDTIVPVAYKLNQDGMILEALDGNVRTFISEVNEMHESLWIGSVTNPYVGVCKA
jgi:Strictosidine synthase